MNTEDQPAHFAWDLLDSIKQVAEEPGPRGIAADVTPETPPISEHATAPGSENPPLVERELEPSPGRPPVVAQQSAAAWMGVDIWKLSWADVGMATEPGQYKSRYGLVEVSAAEVRIWRQHPTAAFVVMQPSPYSGEMVSRLGSFDLRSEANVAGEEKGGR
jgi:hypothetical protein